MDEAIRHSITKMAHFHFTVAEDYRKRVVQLGENPKRVFNFGAPGLDHIKRSKLPSRRRLEKALGVKLSRPTFLITYHPATLGSRNPAQCVKELLAALESFPEARFIFTKTNSDTHGREIIRLVEKFIVTHSRQSSYFISLGPQRYLSMLREADVVIGNSSSGLIEAPSLKTPTINLGERQNGRIRAVSVIDCREKKNEIVAAIRKALSPAFTSKIQKMKSPLEGKNSSFKIKEKLRTVSLEKVLNKPFFGIQGKLK